MKKFMLKTVFLLIFGTVSFTTGIFAETNPVEKILSEKYGQVISRDLETSFEFTVSAEFSEISNILEAANSQEWYVNFVSISSREDGKAAIIFRAAPQKNNFSSKFASLQKILQPGMLIWKAGVIPDNMAVVTNIETTFDQKIMINGVTRKSGLVFSHLIPMIERAAVFQNPFFSRGTYSDTEDGRIMNFTINCDW